MHQIGYRSYHCSTTERQIIKDLNGFAYDPRETSCYHGHLVFHRDIVCKNYDEAIEKLKSLDQGWYDDHAIFYKREGKKYWLVKYEYHC